MSRLAGEHRRARSKSDASERHPLISKNILKLDEDVRKSRLDLVVNSKSILIEPWRLRFASNLLGAMQGFVEGFEKHYSCIE